MNKPSQDSTSIGFFEFIFLMAMMMSLTAFSIDAMMPALPQIGAELGVLNANDNQLIISVIFLGIAIGQFFYGPISDIVGRKKPLYVGLFIFIVGTLISMYAQNMELMLWGRWIQGLGLASPRTVSMAIIRDRFEGDEMAKVISFIMIVFIIVPAIAPGVGQLILYFFSWKAIFMIFLIMAFIILVWFTLRINETLSSAARKSFSIIKIASDGKAVLSHPIALAYMITAGFVSSPFIAFLNSAQQILQEQYALKDYFPLVFALIALTVGSASFVNGRLVQRHGMQKMVKTAILCQLGWSTIFFIIFFFFMNQIPLLWMLTYFLPTFFFTGILFGNMNSLALQPLGHIAGMGAALVGAISTMISVFFGTLISQQYQGTIHPLVIGFLIFAFLSTILIFRTEANRKGS